MKKTELIFGLLSIIAISLNLLYVPFCNVFTILVLGTFATFYFIFSYPILNNIEVKNIINNEAMKMISTARKVGTIGAGFVLSTTIIGILFKIQSYPGAKFELLNGLYGILIIAIIVVYKYLKTKSEFYKKALLRIIIIGGFGLLFYNISYKTIIHTKFRNHPAYAEALINMIAHQGDTIYMDKFQIEREKLHQGE
ncbi:MAG: hypothetical protein WCL51_02605 [Bacteroidota bacterium]